MKVRRHLNSYDYDPGGSGPRLGVQPAEIRPGGKTTKHPSGHWKSLINLFYGDNPDFDELVTSSSRLGSLLS